MSLGKTLNKKSISEEEIKKVFNEKPGNKSSKGEKKRIVTIKPTDQVAKKHRPTFELEEHDYQKLKAVCAFTGKDIGKTITEVMKEWLDDIELVV